VAEILKPDLLCVQEEAISRKRFGKFHRSTAPLHHQSLPSASQSQSNEKFFGINMAETTLKS
jgi:hypothetical protein